MISFLDNRSKIIRIAIIPGYGIKAAKDKIDVPNTQSKSHFISNSDHMVKL